MRRAIGLIAALTLVGHPQLSHAAAAPLDELIAALRASQTRAIRGAATVTLNFPPGRAGERQATALPRLPVVPGLLRRGWSVRQGSEVLLAGRPARRYEAEPLSGQAARWTVWVDVAWKLPLAWEERAWDGSLSRRAAFDTVRSAGPLSTPAAPLAVNGPLRAALRQGAPGLSLPPGFEPLALRTLSAAQPQRRELVLGDGLNVLALVFAPQPVRAAPGVASVWAPGGALWLTGNLPRSILQASLSNLGRLDTAALDAVAVPASGE
jgi:hypothetical protein